MDPRQWLRPRPPQHPPAPPLNTPIPPSPPNSFDSSSIDLNSSPKATSPPPVPLPPPVGIDSLHEGPSSALRPLKRKRGRPRKHAPIVKTNQTTLPSYLVFTGDSFTPHTLTLNPGEDVAAKIWSFSEGPHSRSVTILDADGTVSMAQIRVLTSAGGTTHLDLEGLYMILSLEGICFPSEDGGYGRGGLAVSLKGSDGHIVGGGVSGKLIAASQIQLVLGTFHVDWNQKPKSKGKSGPSSSATPQNAPISVTLTNATSHGASSRSSSYVALHGPGDGTESGSGDENGS